MKLRKYGKIADLCKALQVTPPTIRNAEREGRIKAIRLSPRVVRYDIDAVMEQLATSHEPKATSHEPKAKKV